MRRFELIDGEKPGAVPCAVIECDQAKGRFSATLREGVVLEDVPIQFVPQVRRGEKEVPHKQVMAWVEERIAPPSRQNIGSILKAHGLIEYDPLELLLSGEGRSSQDGFYLREITEGFTRSSRLGYEVRLARKVAGLTQAELSERSGVPQENISRIENGRANPTVVTLEKLARAMGCQITITVG